MSRDFLRGSCGCAALAFCWCAPGPGLPQGRLRFLGRRPELLSGFPPRVQCQGCGDPTAGITWANPTPVEFLTVRRQARPREEETLLLEYYDELRSLFGHFDPTAGGSPPEAEGGVFLVFQEEGQELCCGAIRPLEAGVGEIKRMFTRPAARGRGLARDLLWELEQEARRLGFRRLVLDTAAPLAAALQLYRSQGYEEVPPYNRNPHATHWFARSLE